MRDGEDFAKISSELAQKANYSSASLASLCGMSVRQFQRNFKQTMSQPPKQWLNALRLEAARKLLQDGRSVKEAALSSGYKHSQHFSRDFTKFFGVSPSSARASRIISAS